MTNRTSVREPPQPGRHHPEVPFPPSTDASDAYGRVQSVLLLIVLLLLLSCPPSPSNEPANHRKSVQITATHHVSRLTQLSRRSFRAKEDLSAVVRASKFPITNNRLRITNSLCSRFQHRIKSKLPVQNP